MSKDHQTGTGIEEAPQDEPCAARQDEEVFGSYPLVDPARYHAYLQQLAESELDS